MCALLVLEALVFCGLALYGFSRMDERNDLSTYLCSYSSVEELTEARDELAASYEKCKTEYLELCLDTEVIEERLRVFDYVISHYMESSEAVLYSQTSALSTKDGLGAGLTMLFVVALIMIFAGAVFAVFLFAGDFSGKRYVLLYCGRNRLKLAGEKFRTFLLLLAGNYLVLALVSAVYIRIAAVPVRYVLIFSNGDVRRLPFAAVYGFTLLGQLLQLLPYWVIAFLTAVLSRNEFVTLAAGLILIKVPEMLEEFFELEQPIFIQTPLDYVASEMGTLSQWACHYALEWAVIGVIGVLILLRFRRVRL